MKRISTLFVSLLMLACFSCKAQSEKKIEKGKEVEWYSWNEGYKKSLEDKNKILLVDIYTDWCGWCKRMDKDTYGNEDITKEVKKNFIPIKFNPEADGTYEVDKLKLTGQQLQNMLTNNQGTGYPTIVFMYPKVREIEMMPGYQDATTFKATLKKIVETSKAKSAGK